MKDKHPHKMQNNVYVFIKFKYQMPILNLYNFKMKKLQQISRLMKDVFS